MIINWILSDDHLFFIICLLLLISFFIPVYLYHATSNENKKFFYYRISIIAPLIICTLVVWLSTKTTTEYISNSEWEIIPITNTNIDITLSIDDEHIPINNELGYQYTKLTESQIGTLSIQTNENHTAKTVYINNNNIKIIGNKNEVINTSKIIQIEYRPLSAIKHTYFGKYTITNTPKIDGQIRLLIKSKN